MAVQRRLEPVGPACLSLKALIRTPCTVRLPSAVLGGSQQRCSRMLLDNKRGTGHRPNNKVRPWGSELAKKKKDDDEFFVVVVNAKAGSSEASKRLLSHDL